MLMFSDEIKDSIFLKMMHCNWHHNFWKYTRVRKENIKKLTTGWNEWKEDKQKLTSTPPPKQLLSL